MGVYLVGASTYYLDDDSCWPAVFTALSAALQHRGVQTLIRVPEYVRLPRGSGREFEEKLIPPMTGFSALCSAELVSDDADVFEWSLLVPIHFEGAIELPVQSSYSNTTTVRSAQRLLPVAQRLASVLEMPSDLPEHCDNLQLTEFFMDRDEDGPTETTQRGRWCDDLGTAFYVAMYLRAAEHSIRLNCPMFYT
jgi:hypothetical protein